MKTTGNIEGEKVGALLIGFASLTKTVDNVDAALDHLAAEKILPDAKGYWRANARAGKFCAPNQVKQLCLRLDQSMKKKD